MLLQSTAKLLHREASKNMDRLKIQKLLEHAEDMAGNVTPDTIFMGEAVKSLVEAIREIAKE